MKLLLISVSAIAFATASFAQEVEQGNTELSLDAGAFSASVRNDIFTQGTYEIGYQAWSNEYYSFTVAAEYYDETQGYGVSVEYDVINPDLIDNFTAYGSLDLTYSDDFTTLDAIVGADYRLGELGGVYGEIGTKSLVDSDWVRASSYVELGLIGDFSAFGIVPAIRYDFTAEQYFGNVEVVYAF